MDERIRNGLWIGLSLLLTACTSTDARRSISGDASREIRDLSLQGCDEREFDTPPFIHSGARPIYPLEERFTNKSGVATAVFVVSDTGLVSDMHATAEGGKYFAGHLAYAIQSWKMDPAKRNGHPVSTHCKMVMHFDVGL